MQTKKKVWLGVVTLLAIPAILDAVRYLKPAQSPKQLIYTNQPFEAKDATELVLVYNAWGGIYPGLADIIHKEFFTKTYPCNLCYQTFGTFGMKDEWRNYIDSLPLKIVELHKDNFKNKYTPKDLPLPAILLSNGSKTTVLLSASEINTLHSLEAFKQAVSQKLRR